MSDPLRIRLLSSGDLAFADQVRGLAGWNQTLEDWKRFLAMAPQGCFLAEWSGVPVGTATTIVYDSTLAWIGMVLVHPEYRRRGIGSTLLQHCLRSLRTGGVRCIKLDATPAGQSVYEGLGFQAEWTLTRWQGRWRGGCGSSQVRELRFSGTHAASEIGSLDCRAFGTSRRQLLEALASSSLAAYGMEDASGGLQAFGFLRAGSRALYLGPVIGVSAEAGLAIVRSLLARSEGREIYWDVPDLNAPLVAWVESQGFVRQRSLTRMFLGENLFPGDPSLQMALSGPETG